jgi:hypothetical protein
MNKIFKTTITFIFSVLFVLFMLYNHIFPLNSLHRGIKPDDPALMSVNGVRSLLLLFVIYNPACSIKPDISKLA